MEGAHLDRDSLVGGLVSRPLRGLATALALLAPLAAGAQMPGVPVLQNAFSNPGLTVGGNVGTGDVGSAYAAAVAWAPGSGRFQVSGGIGVLTFKAEDAKSSPTYGVRGAYALPWPRGGTGSFGTAAFVGFGGATNDDASTSTIPVGVSVSYRRALGETRAFSVYGVPFYQWSSFRPKEGEEDSRGQFRGSVGADVTIIPRLGATVGYEFGGKTAAGEAGTSGGVFGAGVSWSFR